MYNIVNLAFQPTLPARGATVSIASTRPTIVIFQPTLPARGATITGCLTRTTSRFQPTLPARGATRRLAEYCYRTQNFNPRSPHGERLVVDAEQMRLINISTHAPRTGSDAATLGDAYFGDLFQPTLPARGATFQFNGGALTAVISTHAPRTGSDQDRCCLPQVL